MQLAREKAITVIQSLHGRIFAATFTKKDGSQRKMVCRTGVKSAYKGTGSYSHTRDLTRANITVFDMQERQYRAIPLNRLHSLTCDGHSYEVH